MLFVPAQSQASWAALIAPGWKRLRMPGNELAWRRPAVVTSRFSLRD
jgi:hypothetical protein